MPVLNLLHLSDLHFGYNRTNLGKKQRAEALDLLIAALPKLAYHVLAISGDLTWQGQSAGYTDLKQWLETKLFPATGLTAADCVFCPGNHDIDRKVTKHWIRRTRDPKEADELLTPDEFHFAPAFQAFVDFAKELKAPQPQPTYLSGVHRHRGLHFICLNSAWFCKDNSDSGNLWLGLPHLQSFPLSKETDYDQAPITIALVHHPQDWFHDAEKNSYGDRPSTYRYLAARCHLILSGHTHGAVENATRHYNRAHCILSGAAYSDHNYRNNFSILQIDTDRRTVGRLPWEYDPRVPTWEKKADQTYSLTIEKVTRRSEADPSLYLKWLREQTELIPLQQLNVSPQDTPKRPLIDLLYVRLKAAGAHALEEALGNRHLVIEGGPGSGKTTFLRWIAWNLCRPDGPPAGFPVRDRLPLWIRITDLDQRIVARKAGDPELAHDARWLPHFLAGQGWGLNEAYFTARLEDADTLLLLDGLDEAANQSRRATIVRLIREGAVKYKCRIVVTTRPGAHEGRATLAGFEVTCIEDLDTWDGIDAFLRQWCDWLGQSEDYRKKLLAAVVIPGIRHLARNPLMLTALAVLHLKRNRLPDHRAKLYEDILVWLAEQAAERHSEYSKDQRLQLFGTLALAMQGHKEGQQLSIAIDDAALKIRPSAPGEIIPFLEQAHLDSGIVTLRGDRLAYWHLSFQEYLAARIQLGFADPELHSWCLKFLYRAEGREVLPLLAACLAEKGPGRLKVLTDILVSDALARQHFADRAHAVSLLGAMLSYARHELPNFVPENMNWVALLQSVSQVFDREGVIGLGPKTRAATAEALDQASQDRLRAPKDPDYWVEVPAGDYPIGGDEETSQSLPFRTVRITTFQIAKYPVTVWEYDQFLNAAKYAAPPNWEEQLRHLGRPVVNVTWHDARGYCDWAEVLLPNEVQWEAAARGTEGRFYPWGNERPDEFRANFGMNVGAPTPVGLFPDGETPSGVAELVGNVWEWTNSEFEPEIMSARGAAFDFDAGNLRAANRIRSGPNNRYVNLGFRCVRRVTR